MSVLGSFPAALKRRLNSAYWSGMSRNNASVRACAAQLAAVAGHEARCQPAFMPLDSAVRARGQGRRAAASRQAVRAGALREGEGVVEPMCVPSVLEEAMRHFECVKLRREGICRGPRKLCAWYWSYDAKGAAECGRGRGARA